MTDKGPRIFRALEKTDGRDSFDAIVRAAAESFVELARPTERQVREFGRLVLPLFDRTDAETRRMLAASLASAPTISRELVERLVAEPTRIVAPFLLASPLLTEADLATLATRRDAATKKILKARAEPEAPAPKRRRAKAKVVGSDPAPTQVAKTRPSPARQTALLSTGTPDLPAVAPAAPPHAEPAAAMPATAEETRTLLRQLATTGRREPAPIRPAAPAAAEADLLTLALARDAERFHFLLAAKLLLDREQVAAIETDATGRELAAALKALDTGKADAMTMIMMLKPAVGSDVAAFEMLERIYETLDVAACRTRYPIGPGAFADAPAHRPLYAETRPVIRPEARSTVFGRRASLPNEDTRKRRS